MRPEQWLNLFGTVSATFLLVVCLIFMVILPIVPLPAFIDLPAAASASKSPEAEGDAIVSIRRTGETYLHSRQIERPLLARELSPARGTLRLRVDRDTPFAHVRAVVAAAQAAGYRQMVIMVRQDAPPVPDEPSDFTLAHCWDCGPDFPAFLVVTLVFFAPVGAFVLRRHIASATGGARLAGRVLQIAALVSLPPAILLVLAILLGML